MNTKTPLLKIIFLAFLNIFFTASCATTTSSGNKTFDASRDYDRIQSTISYRNLATLDLDQVNDLVQLKLNDFAKQNNVQALKEAALIIFSRPDDDGVVEKVLSNIRNPLEEENEWQNTVVALVRQSVETIRNDQASAADQVTAGVTLENIIAELKPAYIKQYKTGGFDTDVINHIAESGAHYSKAASNERGLYLMRNNLDPVQLAKKIVSAKESYLKQEKNK